MSPTHETTYKLDQLAEQAGVSARTVRYYVQRGLLPAPAFRGRDTVYTHEHLLRLRAIKRLQEQYLPLDAIQVEIERRSPEELRELAEGRGGAVGPGGAGTGTGTGTGTGSGRDDGFVVVPKRTHEHPPEVRHPYRAPVSVNRPGERWERWALLPGLELHLSDEAGAGARELAEEIRALCARRARHGG